MKGTLEGLAAFAYSLLYLGALIFVCAIPMLIAGFVLGLIP